MKRFYFGFGASFFLAPLLMIGLALGLPTPKVGPARWVGDCLRAQLAVAREEQKPQIVILSGSNALFGFSAHSLHDSKGLRAVNLGSHAGLGLKYILHYGMTIAQKGDLFVLPLEFDLYDKERYEGALSLQVLANDQAYFWTLPTAEKIRLVSSITLSEWLAFVRNRFRPDAVDGTGCRPETLTKFGDQTTNNRADIKEKTRAVLLTHKPRTFLLDAQAKKNLQQFKREIEKRGASFVLAYPNIRDMALDERANKAFFDDLESFAAAEDIIIIGALKDRVFSLDQAFDTEYHVNNVRQEENTEILLRQLSSVDLKPFR